MAKTTKINWDNESKKTVNYNPDEMDRLLSPGDYNSSGYDPTGGFDWSQYTSNNGTDDNEHSGNYGNSFLPMPSMNSDYHNAGIQNFSSGFDNQAPVSNNSGLWNDISNGFMSGINKADKMIMDIPSTVYKPFSWLSSKIVPGYDASTDPILQGLNKAGDYYKNSANEYDANVGNSTTSKVASTIAGFVPQAIETALTFGIPIPKVGTMGKVLDSFGTPIEQSISGLLNNSKIGDYAGKVAKNAAEFAALNSLGTATQGGNWSDVGKSALEGAGEGALFGIGGKALGDAFSHFVPGIGKAKVLGEDGNNVILQDEAGNQTPMNKAIFDNTATEITNTNKLSNLSGKTYTVKNTAKDQAMQDYTDAIDTIHNYFGTNKLTPEEVARIKPELGIDLNQLISNMDNAKTDVGAIGDRQRLRQIAGVDNTAFHPSGDGFGIPQTTKYPINEMPTLVNPKKAIGDVETEGNTNMPFEIKLPGSAPKSSKINYDEINDIDTLNNHISKLQAAISNTKDETKLKAMKLQLFSAQDRLKKLMDIVKPNIEDTTNKIVSSKDNNKFSFKNAWKNFYTRTVDIHNPTNDWSKASGDKAYIKSLNSANAGSIVGHMFNDGLVDMNGNKIGFSLKELAKQIPRGKEESFWNYMLHKHNVQRAALDKNVFPNYDSAASANAVKEYEALNPDLKKAGDNINKWLNKFMNEWGNKSGLISDDLWTQLQKMYPNYIPTDRSLTELEDAFQSGNGKGFVNQSSPIKKAKGGDQDIINPLENIMNLVNRTVRTAKYNQVGQEVLNSLREKPDSLKKYAEIIPEDSGANLTRDNVVTVLDKGEKVHLRINDKPFLDALQALNKGNSGPIESFFKKGTGLFKDLITTKNPVFALRNVARDIPTYLVNSKENNPFKALGNLGSAFKDVVTNADSYKQYKGVGGGGSNFFNSEHPYKSAEALTHTSKNPLHYLSEGIEKFNNAFESAPRLAEFKNTLKKTGDINQALYDASDVTTNFARHGDITKTVDSAVPYLNAGVQGLDKLARQFNTPKKALMTTAKGVATITLPTVALNQFVNKDNPNYQKLDDRTKDNYYLIPNGDTFIKIPKSRELGVLFGSLAERVMRKAEGDPEAFKGFFKNGDGLGGIASGTVATNFAPANPIENNIFAPLIYNIPSNKDFAGRAIVPQNMIQDQRSPYLQYDEKTSDLAKKIGELTNLSPKQIDYVIKSYTGVLGQLGLPMMQPINEAKGAGENLLNTVTSQFTADPLYNNQSLQDFYENMGNAKTEATDNNILNKIDSKTTTHEERLSSEFTKANKEISELNKAANEALKNGDMQKVKDIRQQIISKAEDVNKYILTPGQDDSVLPMPAGEVKANIDNNIKYNREDDAKQVREKSDQIYKSNLSVEEKTRLLNQLLNQSKGIGKGVAPTKKATKTNPYNKSNP